MKQFVPLSKIVFSVLLLSYSFVFSQTKEQQDLITSRYDFQKLNQLENQFSSKVSQEKQAAIQYAQQRGIETKITLEDGGLAELQRIDPDGSLIYYRTLNVAAARSTRTNQI